MTLRDARRYGVLDHFLRARKAGLIISAGYETSVKADDWLDSPAGRRALQDKEG